MVEFMNPFENMVPKRKLTHRELIRSIRMALSAEEEANHLYESLADATDNPLVKRVLQDIANEERVHKGEFQRLINILAEDEERYLAEGAKEVDEIQAALGEASEASSGNTPAATVGDLRNKLRRSYE